MIFERAARREFAQAAAGISVVLLAIVLSVQLIRLLKDAAGGSLAPEGVLAMLAFAAVRFLPMLLTLTLFVAVLLSLSRMYRDSEMVVWLSSGMPLTRWLRPVLRFAMPIVIAVAALSLVLSPWANLAQGNFEAALSARSELSSVAAGAFKEVRGGRQVYFVERMDDKAGRIGNVFIASMQEGKLGVVVSDAGGVEVRENGDRFLVLESGRRYEVEPGSAAFRVMDFARYAVRTEDGDARPIRQIPRRVPLLDLVSMPEPEMRGELLGRIAIPISAVILALLAIPLSYVNPRAGRSANLLIAIIVYAIYSNLISISQAWVTGDKLPFAVGLLLPHLVMLLPLLILFRGRLTGSFIWQKRRVA
ncbi:lipopolysaccharide export system permease protein [Azonexus fungiphilus]|uniref:Lipopolysaccharide export system permease protein LptF n=1 Tax=Azonexus fungiphilus TaxID=146940 RepID=A0A495WCE9_9RHOO|nr:LPS export ABC transporter permease LptF [Azonexus fungiphilus]RKT59361.1 lipopolysaccharide export system permease protein [Azonexus fungiphilus]